MFRGFILSLTVVFLTHLQFFQIFSLNFQTIGMIILVGQLRPFNLPFDNTFDMANEFGICLFNYHLICLTDFILDSHTRWLIGYTMITLTCLLIFVNVGLLLMLTV